MYITLKQLFEFDIFNNAKLKTDNQNLNDTIVEWVSVIETPVENFVRKNELVLCTGIGCGEDEETFYQFVKDVIDSGASALAISTGKYIYSIPKRIIDFANHHRFSIIVLPWEIRFADIIHRVIQGFNQQKDKLVEKSKEVQQHLLNLILRGGSLNDILRYVYSSIKKPVIITDKRGQIKAESKKAKKLISAWNEYLHNKDYALSLMPFESNNFTSTQNMQHISLGHSNLMQIIIQSSSEIQGYLIIELDHDSDQLDTENHSLIHILEHVATAVALCFLQENTIVETEMRLRDDFVWSLAKGTIKSWDQILSRSKSIGCNVNLPYVCLIGLPENLQAVFGKTLGENPFDIWVQSITRRIEDEIFYTGKKMSTQVLSTFQRQQFIIFLEVKDGDINQTVQQFTDLLNTRLKQLIPDLVFSWGIGKTAGLKCFHVSYDEANIALETGRKLKGIGHRSLYTETRIDRALMSFIQNSELQKITKTTIGSLLKYDKERGIDLINTYITYSRNRGNVSQTARELNLHRQSLQYRLRKIESLTDCKLENPDDVLLLDLTIKLWSCGILDQHIIDKEN